MEEPIETEDWPEKWPAPETLSVARCPSGWIEVFYRPSKVAPDHVTNFVVCEITGLLENNKTAGRRALFEGFRKWDDCTQLRALSTHYFLHWDDKETALAELAAIHAIIWSKELDPGERSEDP